MCKTVEDRVLKAFDGARRHRPDLWPESDRETLKIMLRKAQVADIVVEVERA